MRSRKAQNPSGPDLKPTNSITKFHPLPSTDQATASQRSESLDLVPNSPRQNSSGVISSFQNSSSRKVTAAHMLPEIQPIR